MMQISCWQKKLGSFVLFGIFTAALGCIAGFKGLSALTVIGFPGSFFVLLPWGDIMGLKVDWKLYLEMFAFAAIGNIIFYALIFCLWQIAKKLSGKLFRKKLEPQA